MLKFVTSTLIGGLAAVLIGAPSQAKELRVLSAWDTSFIFHETMLQPYLDKIEKETNGRITFRVSGPDAVPTFEQLQPVQAGAFDILFTHPGYHAGTTAVGNMIDAVYADVAKRRETGIWDWIDKHYQGHGLKLLSMPPQGEKGLTFVTKEPLKQTDQPFAGMKVRGNVTYHGMIQALGGTPVLMSGGDVYSALERGVIDGAAWARVGIVSYKWNEVAKYYTMPPYAQTGTFLLMNLNTWNSLSEEDRAVFDKVGLEIEKETVDLFNELNEKEEQDMQSLGMQPTYFPESVVPKLDKLLTDGLWQMGIDKTGQPVKDFRAVVESKGMTPQ